MTSCHEQPGCLCAEATEIINLTRSVALFLPLIRSTDFRIRQHRVEWPPTISSWSTRTFSVEISKTHSESANVLTHEPFSAVVITRPLYIEQYHLSVAFNIKNRNVPKHLLIVSFTQRTLTCNLRQPQSFDTPIPRTTLYHKSPYLKCSTAFYSLNGWLTNLFNVH